MLGLGLVFCGGRGIQLYECGIDYRGGGWMWVVANPHRSFFLVHPHPPIQLSSTKIIVIYG